MGTKPAVRVGGIALAASVAVHGLVIGRPGLERLFLQLTAGGPGAGAAE